MAGDEALTGSVPDAACSPDDARLPGEGDLAEEPDLGGGAGAAG